MYTGATVVWLSFDSSFTCSAVFLQRAWKPCRAVGHEIMDWTHEYNVDDSQNTTKFIATAGLQF
jgi:hypothetical protein